MIGRYLTCRLEGCGKSLGGLRDDSCFCSAAHRSKWHRQRVKADLAELAQIRAEARS